MWVQSLGREDPLEQKMAPHSSFLAWKFCGQKSLLRVRVCVCNVKRLHVCPILYFQRAHSRMRSQRCHFLIC